MRARTRAVFIVKRRIPQIAVHRRRVQAQYTQHTQCVPYVHKCAPACTQCTIAHIHTYKIRIFIIIVVSFCSGFRCARPRPYQLVALLWRRRNTIAAVNSVGNTEPHWPWTASSPRRGYTDGRGTSIKTEILDKNVWEIFVFRAFSADTFAENSVKPLSEHISTSSIVRHGLQGIAHQRWVVRQLSIVESHEQSLTGLPMVAPVPRRSITSRECFIYI